MNTGCLCKVCLFLHAHVVYYDYHENCRLPGAAGDNNVHVLQEDCI